jgi:hypothetical protein
VYITTQKKINEIWCGNTTIALTEAQTEEITQFKEKVSTYEEAGVPVPTDIQEILGAEVSPEAPSLNDEETDSEDVEEKKESFWSRIWRGISSFFGGSEEE